MFEVQKMYNSCTIHPEAGCISFLSKLQELGIEVKDYPDHKMWLLNYSQIDAIKNHPVVNECRGLLMGYDGTIIRKGFTRFYNLGENGVDTFDFEYSIAFEKADGSLMFVYWCPPTNQWEIGTRGTAFAEGPNEWHGTFRGFMLKAMGRTEEQFQQDCTTLARDKTYLYEAVGPDNRIVTPYATNHLIKLSTIVTATGVEYLCCNSSDIAFELYFLWNVRMIRHYAFNTQEDCMAALNALKGLEEGYVVYNQLTLARVKIKNAVYLAAHRLRGNGLTVNAICELVALNEHAEYIAVFPEDEVKFAPTLAEFQILKDVLEAHWFTYRDISDQKEFALKVKDLPLSGVLFKAKRPGSDIIQVFNSFPVSRKAEWIKDRLLMTDQYKAVLVSEGHMDARHFSATVGV